MNSTQQRRLGALAGIAAAGLLSLSACADDAGSGGGGGGDGVEFGASMEDYQAAFADIDPISLYTQSPAPKGSPVGRPFEDYYAAVEEWSDGKITFDIQYANAVAAPTEVDDALADGRLDVGSVMAVYEPDLYPAYAALSDTSYMGNRGPTVMNLAPHAYVSELAWNNEQVVDDFAKRGVRMLLPSFTGGINALFCSQPRQTLADFEGKQARISGTAHVAEIEALGGSSTTLDYTELFEALQRNAIDCAFSASTAAVLGGIAEVAPYVVLDENAPFGQAPSAFSISESTWQGLPLVAQQLLFDRTDVFLQANMEELFTLVSTVVTSVADNGGEVLALDEAASAAVIAANDEFLEAVADNDAVDDADEVVADIREASERWAGIITGELGYDDSVPYSELDEWLAANGTPDLTPFMDKLYGDVFSEHRPE